MTAASGRWAALRANPGYTAVRGIARFRLVRGLVVKGRSLATRASTVRFEAARRAELGASAFSQVDPGRFVETLRRDGMAPGLRLPAETVAAIRSFAEHHPVYADREPQQGFPLHHRSEAEAALGKQVLVAQYFNAARECPEIAALARDPFLELAASRFLGSIPRLVGTSLWWTFPVDATEQDRARHAHQFHRDVDDFAFVKFFFYLTSVATNDGGHVCVLGSQHHDVGRTLRDRFRLRRYTDDEVIERFGTGPITEICGEAGEGFAENTLCIHKGLTPTASPRLLLQFEFALFDHGVMHDERPSTALGELQLAGSL